MNLLSNTTILGSNEPELTTRSDVETIVQNRTKDDLQYRHDLTSFEAVKLDIKELSRHHVQKCRRYVSYIDRATMGLSVLAPVAHVFLHQDRISPWIGLETLGLSFAVGSLCRDILWPLSQWRACLAKMDDTIYFEHVVNLIRTSDKAIRETACELLFITSVRAADENSTARNIHVLMGLMDVLQFNCDDAPIGADPESGSFLYFSDLVRVVLPMILYSAERSELDETRQWIVKFKTSLTKFEGKQRKSLEQSCDLALSNLEDRCRHTGGACGILQGGPNILTTSEPVSVPPSDHETITDLLLQMVAQRNFYKRAIVGLRLLGVGLFVSAIAVYIFKSELFHGRHIFMDMLGGLYWANWAIDRFVVRRVRRDERFQEFVAKLHQPQNTHELVELIDHPDAVVSATAANLLLRMLNSGPTVPTYAGTYDGLARLIRHTLILDCDDRVGPGLVGGKLKLRGDLLVAIVDAAPRIFSDQCIAAVSRDIEKLASSTLPEPTVLQGNLILACKRVLPSLQARLEAYSARRELLRPASSSDTSAIELVRPTYRY